MGSIGLNTGSALITSVPRLDKNILSINENMKHYPNLDVIFSNNRCYIVNKHHNKLVGMGVEDHGLFFLVSDYTILEHTLMTNNGQDRWSLWHQRNGYLNLHYLSFLLLRKSWMVF